MCIFLSEWLHDLEWLSGILWILASSSVKQEIIPSYVKVTPSPEAVGNEMKHRSSLLLELLALLLLTWAFSSVPAIASNLLHRKGTDNYSLSPNKISTQERIRHQAYVVLPGILVSGPPLPGLLAILQERLHDQVQEKVNYAWNTLIWITSELLFLCFLFIPFQCSSLWKY